MNTSIPQKFSLLLSFKLGSFNLGSALADILVTSVWNRIVIAELGISATPVALLIGLRYLLAPLAIWFGYQSDANSYLGKQRTPYIYVGRLLLWLALPMLPLVVAELARDSSSLIGWALGLAVFVLYGLGTFISGGPFLALVRDSAPASRKGMAVIIAETFLLAGFATFGILYGRLMPDYTMDGLWRLVGVAMVGSALAWVLSIWGEERRITKAANADLEVSESPRAEVIPFKALVKTMWNQPNTRFFFGMLAMGAIALFAQDVVLEPLGAELFGMDVGQTTRFSAYYGTGVLLTMIIGSIAIRKRPPQAQTRLTAVGLGLVMVTLGLLALTAIAHWGWFINYALFLFGVASGVYTVGGLSLMVAMTDERHAGAYLGVWALSQLVFRGVGIAFGGVVLDTVQWLSGVPAWGYAAVFIMEIVAAGIALYCLGRAAKVGYLFTPRQAPSLGEAMAVAGD
jgi:BCD family chlorophyll transporter-like MFS transporter